MKPERQRELLDEHAKVLLALRDLHEGRVTEGDPASREKELGDDLLRIDLEFANHQFSQQQRTTFIDKAVRMAELAISFPSLSSDVPGVSPWTPEVLNDWAQSGAPGHGAKCAADFLLYVWNPHDDTPWAHRFELAEALKTWNVFHRHAFLKWAEEPFWP